MVRDISDKMFDDILANGGSQYFFHKLENGLVEVVFKSGIRKVEPGEEDSAGRIWNPKLTDANGNPALDKNGNPREPWAKFEAEVTIKGVPMIYSFSGEKSAILRNFIMAMKQNEISNPDLPETKWSIERIGQWDWKILYLGKEDKTSSPSPSIQKSSELNTIKEALAKKKDFSPNGISMGNLLMYLATVTHKKPEEIKQLIPQLVAANIIKEENNLVRIL